MRHPPTRITASLALLTLGCAGPDHSAPASAPTAQPAALPADLDQLAGDTWTGSLTYLDYTTREPFTMPATLAVTRIPGAADPSWTFRLGYPDEPRANSEHPITLSANGTLLDGETILERTPLPAGGIHLVTETDGEDDEHPARVRHEYDLSPNSCTIRKLVRPQGSPEFFERNTYRWTRA
jgi:hypothetical protein